MLDVGMLWLDDSKNRSFEEKLLRAVDYYRDKYGRVPNLCLVNKKMLEDEKKIGGIQVRPVANVLLHHFWLGHRLA